MLAVFKLDGPTVGEVPCKGTAAALKGITKWKRQADVDNVREREADELADKLSGLATTLDEDQASCLAQEKFAEGVNGLTYVQGPRTSFSSTKSGSQGIACFFSGDLTQKHINEIHIDRHLKDENDCDKIIHTYTDALSVHAIVSGFIKGTDFSSTTIVRDALRSINGPYAFILYDRVQRRVMAARDPRGDESLFWAVSADGNSLYFSSDKLALYKDGEAVTEFPKGGVFISRPGQLAGTLNGRSYNNPRAMMHPVYSGGVKGRRDSASSIPEDAALKTMSESGITDLPTALPRQRRATEMAAPSGSPFESVRGMRSSMDLLR